MQPLDQPDLQQEIRQLLQLLPPGQREALMVGAIPHWLDAGLAERLFPGQSEQTLKFLAEIQFLSPGLPEQFVYPASFRSSLLQLWQEQDPGRFRKLSGSLAQEFLRRLKGGPGSRAGDQSDRSFEYSAEWLFHAIAEDPAYGMVLAARLFQQLLESFEIGQAERLVRLIEEQKPWLAGQSRWLEFFPAALALRQYKPANLDKLEELPREQSRTSLAAAMLRLRGDQAVQDNQWDQARGFYRQALWITRKLGDSDGQALIQMHLGDLYRRWAESSGGILEDKREFASPFHVFLYSLVHGPLLLYEALADRINFLPNLHGSNYQNWVAARLMNLALRSYRRAERHFKRFNNQNGLAELAGRMGKLLLDLKYLDSARHLCELALDQPAVANSRYYRARVEAILAESSRKPDADSLGKLAHSLDQLEHFKDWTSARETGMALADQQVRTGQPAQAVTTYGRCLEFARYAKDLLLQTEVARRLDALAISLSEAAEEADRLRESIGHRTKSLLPQIAINIHLENQVSSLLLRVAAKEAIRLRDSVTRRVYINRYPGPVHEGFRRLANWLAYPFMFLFLVLIIFAANIAIQIVEAVIGQGKKPDTWLDWLAMAIGVLLPLLIVWTYHILYALLGKLVANTMPLPRVGQSQPELYIIDETGMIVQKRKAAEKGGKEKEQEDFRMNWNEPSMAVLDDRSLYRQPLTFSARTILQSRKGERTLPASIHHYLNLRAEIARLVRGCVIKVELSILRTYWLGISLLAGLVVGMVNWIGNLFPACYNYKPAPGENCPVEHEVIVQPSILLALLFACLVFVVITVVRWQRANRRVAKALKVGKAEIAGAPEEPLNPETEKKEEDDA